MPDRKNILDDFSEVKNEFSDHIMYSEKTSLNFNKSDSYITLMLLNISIFLFLIAFWGDDFSPPVKMENRMIIIAAAFVIFYIPSCFYYYSRYIIYKTSYELTEEFLVIVEPHQELRIPLENIKTLIPRNYAKVKQPFAGTKILNAGEEGKIGIDLTFKESIKYQKLFFPSKKNELTLGPLETNELFKQLEKQMNR